MDTKGNSFRPLIGVNFYKHVLSAIGHQSTADIVSVPLSGLTSINLDTQINASSASLIKFPSPYRG